MTRPPRLALAALTWVLMFASSAHAASVIATWNANTESDLAGYKLKYGQSPGVHGTVIDVGNATTRTVSGLTAGATYYFVVTAYDLTGNESGPSGEASVTLASANTPPTVTAPADKTVEATGALTAVSLGSATVTDAEDTGLSATPDDTGPFSIGTHTITWTVTDSGGLSAFDTQTITVQDTTAPTVTAPADKTVEATGTLTTVSLGSATATDLVDGSVSATASDTGPFSRGTHTITWTATDSEGNTGTATQTVTITDTTPPSAPTGTAVTP
jgi:hypothetical protein